MSDEIAPGVKRHVDESIEAGVAARMGHAVWSFLGRPTVQGFLWCLALIGLVNVLWYARLWTEQVNTVTAAVSWLTEPSGQTVLDKDGKTERVVTNGDLVRAVLWLNEPSGLMLTRQAGETPVSVTNSELLRLVLQDKGQAMLRQAQAQAEAQRQQAPAAGPAKPEAPPSPPTDGGRGR